MNSHSHTHVTNAHSIADRAPSSSTSSRAEAKRDARRAARDALRARSRVDLAREDVAIGAHFNAMTSIQRARSMCAYFASARLRECATMTIVADALGASKRVFAPVADVDMRSMRVLHVADVDNDCVVRGTFELLEPKETYEDGTRRLDAMRDVATVGALAVVVVPGLAFDARGGRLGRGMGFYDAFLCAYKEEIAKRGLAPPLVVALAYECQMMEEVPTTERDERVDVVVLAAGPIACTPAGERALALSVEC